MNHPNFPTRKMHGSRRRLPCIFLVGMLGCFIPALGCFILALECFILGFAINTQLCEVLQFTKYENHTG